MADELRDETEIAEGGEEPRAADVEVDEEEGGDYEDAEPLESLGRDETRAVLHGLLFVSDKPLSPERMAEVLGDADPDVVRMLLAELREQLECGDAPYRLLEIAGGYQLITRSEHAPYIRRLLQIKKQNRLSKAALETLAIVAYKQPCTRAEIESIRGVSVSHAFEILQEKRMIKAVGVAETPGRPKLYRTTDEFLLHFGIKSLRDLPSVNELRETM